MQEAGFARNLHPEPNSKSMMKTKLTLFVTVLAAALFIGGFTSKSFAAENPPTVHGYKDWGKKEGVRIFVRTGWCNAHHLEPADVKAIEDQVELKLLKKLGLKKNQASSELLTIIFQDRSKFEKLKSPDDERHTVLMFGTRHGIEFVGQDGKKYRSGGYFSEHYAFFSTKKRRDILEDLLNDVIRVYELINSEKKPKDK